MIHCIYNTDPAWARFLAVNEIVDEVNFWRRDERTLRLRSGDQFYFKIRKSPYVVGRGVYQSSVILSVAAAWARFGHKNGCLSESAFREEVSKVLQLDNIDCAFIQCISLRNIQWLPDNNYFRITRATFASQQMKYLLDTEAQELIQHFTSAFRGNTRPQ